jgi:very-short-patch-repair endonuclease
VAPEIRPEQIRDHIAYFLQEQVKAYEIEAVCDRLGMPPGKDAWTYNSKRVYVQNRLARVAVPELLHISRAVVEEFVDPELEQLLDDGGFRGVDGELKNIIFAADGAKPQIVLRDAINNVIEIVEGGRSVPDLRSSVPSDREDSPGASSWTGGSRTPASRMNEKQPSHLYRHLERAVASPPERLLFKSYRRRYAGGERDTPALIPQVYLHYSPYTNRELRAIAGAEMPRQRMDFLLLPSERARVVIEVDGKQHYAEANGKASPSRYAEMVREDRAIRLRGYEVFRFGGAELSGALGENLADEFFELMMARSPQ